MNQANERLHSVRNRIAEACKNAGRPVASVKLLAVSKRQPAAAIEALYALGQTAFGENLLQEAREKQNEIGLPNLEWHFIGPVQSNKTRALAEHFDWVQSVDREKILRRLAQQRPDHLPPLNICIQVNIDRERQKAGAEPEQVAHLAGRAEECPTLRLRGLMCIPRLTEDVMEARHSFRAMKLLYDELVRAGHALDTLSMGMSGDLELAIEEGSNMIRVGTGLFGARPASRAC